MPPTGAAPKSAAIRCALASALDKIARGAERIHNPDAERNPATAHLFIINPLSGERMDNLFSTHPDTENRIAALQAMAESTPSTGHQEAAPDSRTAPSPKPRSQSVGPQPDRTALAFKGPWS